VYRGQFGLPANEARHLRRQVGQQPRVVQRPASSTKRREHHTSAPLARMIATIAKEYARAGAGNLGAGEGGWNRLRYWP